MHWSIIESRWNEFRVAAKRRWDKLSEQQIAGTQGKREHLASRVREAYSLTREEAEGQVGEWQDALVDTKARAASG